MTNEQINRSIETKRLEINNWGKFDHYTIVGFMFLIPIIQVFLYLKELVNGTSKGINGDMVLFIIIPLILGFLLYKLQRNRLNFKIIETNLNREQLEKIIDQVAKELKWEIFTDEKRIVEAKTFPNFFSGSWGEQITILFDGQQVLINSICDLDKRSSLVSMGRNRKNMKRLVEEIKKASC